MKIFVKYFSVAVIISILVLATLYIQTGSTFYLQQAIVLAIIEISVSFDNAVVNASNLRKMNAFWRKMFLTIGILVAVGLMRLYLPLEIVSQFGNIPLKESYNLALHDHDKFSSILITAHSSIAGFGGAFLGMVALHFFLDEEKEAHWFKGERFLSYFSGTMLYTVNVIITMLVLGGVTCALFLSKSNDTLQFFSAGVAGIIIFLLVEALKHFLKGLDSKLASSKFKWLAGGLGTFIYLEILDASFSLDGVIAAFAISKDVLPITVGLGIGALMIRCLTMLMFDKELIIAYKYLENGAFYAISVLALSMLLGVHAHVPEWFVAGFSVLAIGGALVSSIVEDRRKANKVIC